jgi:basic amino acid/polyamine antiporter, APA family
MGQTEGTSTREQTVHSLGICSIILIILNSVLGGDVFFLPSAGGALTGIHSLVVWIFVCCIGLYIARCFAELASLYPTSGGIYHFVKEAFGKPVAFFVGWSTLLGGYLMIAWLVVYAISYVAIPFGHPYGFTQDSSALLYLLLGFSILAVVFFNYIAHKGIDFSAKVLVALSVFMLVIIAIIVVPGLFSLKPELYSKLTVDFPRISFTDFSSLFPFGQTFFVLIMAYFGWETITFLAGQTTNGGKLVSKSIVLSSYIVTGILLIVAIVSLGIVDSQTLGDSWLPFLELSSVIYGVDSITILAILMFISMIGSVGGWILGAPQVLVAMATDGLFLRQLAYLHPVTKTPTNALLFQTCVLLLCIILSVFYDPVILSLIVLFTLFSYIFILLSVVVLRYKKSHAHREYSAPFVPFVPLSIIGVLIASVWLWAISTDKGVLYIQLGASLLLCAIPLYMLVELYTNPAVSRKLKDFTVYLTLLFEQFFIPLHIQKELLAYLGDVRSKIVLEFGSSIGTLTRHLIYSVSKSGTVICVNNSQTELSLLQKRISTISPTSRLSSIKGSIKAVHHLDYDSSILSLVSYADCVVSIDALSSITKPREFLNQIHQLLPNSGRICFFDFVDFFHIIPNQHWLSTNEQITALFAECGFAVRVKRTKTLFWSYVFIYGFKSDNTGVPVI